MKVDFRLRLAARAVSVAIATSVLGSASSYTSDGASHAAEPGPERQEQAAHKYGGPTPRAAARRHRRALRRRDVPPAGVRHRVDYFSVGDGSCGEPGPRREAPHVVLDRRPLYQTQWIQREEEKGGELNTEIGESIFICPRGFARGRPVKVLIRGPRGSVRRTRLPPVRGGEQRLTGFLLGQHQPLGRYQVTVRQGNLVKRAGFKVVLPRHRGARISELSNFGFANIRSQRLLVVGQPPQSHIWIDVYFGRYSPYRYATSLSVSTDKYGIGSTSFVADQQVPKGMYLFKPRQVRDPEDFDEDAFLCVRCQ